MSGYAHGETCQWLQYVGDTEDPRGNVTPLWADPVDVDGCGYSPGGSVEPRPRGSERVITTPQLFVPRMAGLASRDRWSVRGSTFEAEGDPADWRNPLTGRVAERLVVNLKRVEG